MHTQTSSLSRGQTWPHELVTGCAYEGDACERDEYSTHNSDEMSLRGIDETCDDSVRAMAADRTAQVVYLCEYGGFPVGGMF